MVCDVLLLMPASFSPLYIIYVLFYLKNTSHLIALRFYAGKSRSDIKKDVLLKRLDSTKKALSDLGAFNP